MRHIALLGLAVIAAMQPVPAVGQNPSPQVQAAPPIRPALQQQSSIPQATGLLVLIRSTLVALHQANMTGNYAVLWAVSSDKFRAANTPQGLAQGFAGFRNARVDLSPVIYLDPQVSSPPAIEANRLHLVGFFPSSPARINFDLFFEPSQGQWKLAQINASLSQVR
jgi:hypothetical protein